MSEQTTLRYPVIFTRGMIVYPNNKLTLDVGRPLSLEAVEQAHDDFEDNIIMVSQIDPVVENPTE